MRSGPMTVPVVTAFSASCSRNGTTAPRPATSAGSSPARVTDGPGGVAAAELALTMIPVATRARAADAAIARTDRRVIFDSFLLGVCASSDTEE